MSSTFTQQQNSTTRPPAAPPEQATPQQCGTVIECRDASENLQNTLNSLLNTAANGRGSVATQSALNVKVKELRSSLESLRQSVNSLPDLDLDVESQIHTINSLQRQARAKNEFVIQVRKRSAIEILPSSAKIEESVGGDPEPADSIESVAGT